MKYWDAIRIFYLVANAGSYTKAADVLHTSQANLSRTISLLEKRLGVKLFDRHARGLRLTAEGCILYESARVASSHLEKADILLHELEVPYGALTVGTAAATWLLP